MTDVEKLLLENQEIIMIALANIILKLSDYRSTESIHKINKLIDQTHLVRKLLKKDYDEARLPKNSVLQ